MSSSKLKSETFQTTSAALGRGIRIHYYRSTPTSDIQGRLPILLLHGFPQNSYMWKEVARRLQGDYELIVADLRGKITVYAERSTRLTSNYERLWKKLKAKGKRVSRGVLEARDGCGSSGLDVS